MRRRDFIAILGGTLVAWPVDAHSAPGAIRVERTKDNHSVVSISVPLPNDEGDAVQAKFDFGETRGFLGPSSKPSDEHGFVNVDGTITAINHQPVTKSSYVHIWLRMADGDLLFLNNVNERVARLLKGPFSESAKEFLRVEAISGRKISIQTVDFGDSRKDYNFAVMVGDKGDLSLAK